MPFAVPLIISSERHVVSAAPWEPVRFGVPCAPGVVTRDTPFHLRHATGTQPVDATVLESWPDGSVRWLLIDGCLLGQPAELFVVAGPCPDQHGRPTLQIQPTPEGWRVDTGKATFDIGAGGLLGLIAVDLRGCRHDLSQAQLTLSPVRAAAVACRPSKVRLMRSGTQVAQFAFEGSLTVDGASVLVFGEVEVFAGARLCRFRVSLRNPRAATHPSGHWELGSPSSIMLESLVLQWPGVGSPVATRLDVDQHVTLRGTSVRLHQESSGGPRWNHRTHLDARRTVPLAYRGFRAMVDGLEHEGLRAEPILTTVGAELGIAVAMPCFWQNCPKALAAGTDGLMVALYPKMTLGSHELQGGEQKTHELIIDFMAAEQASTLVSEVAGHPLAWVHTPRLVHAPPAYYAEAGAVASLSPKTESTCEAYERLVDRAIDGPHSFDAKRDSVDEYGWRHFGDIWADHEGALYDGPDGPFVSHYNNQYDAVQGLALQFMRSGDPRWWRHMDELARHVVDVDIYHTDGDKNAYNHGMFWHTAHYVDADTSSHRTYPARGGAGGGPSPGHLYSRGLLLHHYLTGATRSRDAVLELADYVVNCDDGRQTPLRYLSRAATGHATASGTATYHGPGRASGNSLVALLNGYRLTRSGAYVAAMEEIVQRCFHPSQNLQALRLDDIENRWFYTIHMLALCAILEEGDGEVFLQRLQRHARLSLLVLTRWMLANESPYLARSAELEYPNETWAAQDMRKAVLFLAAAGYAESETERDAFVARSRFFFEYAVDTLTAMPTSVYTRPTVLLLGLGWQCVAPRQQLAPVSPLPLPEWPLQPPFEPQKVIAIRRLKRLAVAATAAALLGTALVL